jgi:hypothetical protein
MTNRAGYWDVLYLVSRAPRFPLCDNPLRTIVSNSAGGMRLSTARRPTTLASGASGTRRIEANPLGRVNLPLV